MSGPVVRALPVKVRPLPGETVTGFTTRLAEANGLPARQLRLHVRDMAGLSATHTDLERGAGAVERIAGLPTGHFAADARRQAMWVRCSHHGWQPHPCRRCGYPQAPRAVCLRCARGAATTVVTRGGGVCNRHRRWHTDGADIDISHHADYGHAERCLSGTLWKRGIGLATGELQLATTLIDQWATDSGATARLRRRADTVAHGDWRPETVLLIVYPEAVRLSGVLTDASFTGYLLSARFRFADQVAALEAAVVTIVEGSTNPRLHDIAERIVAHGREGVEMAMGTRANANVRRSCQLERALIAASQRHRNCLLRHLSTVRVKITNPPLGVAAPQNRVLDRRRPTPDPLIVG